MKSEIEAIILTTLNQDATVTKQQVQLALDVLKGAVGPEDVSPRSRASQKLEEKGRLLKCTEAAKRLGVTTQCLINWREKKGLKPFIPPGNTKALGYWEADILDFISRVETAKAT